MNIKEIIENFQNLVNDQIDDIASKCDEAKSFAEVEFFGRNYRYVPRGTTIKEFAEYLGCDEESAEYDVMDEYLHCEEGTVIDGNWLSSSALC